MASGYNHRDTPPDNIPNFPLPELQFTQPPPGFMPNFPPRKLFQVHSLKINSYYNNYICYVLNIITTQYSYLQKLDFKSNSVELGCNVIEGTVPAKL